MRSTTMTTAAVGGRGYNRGRERAYTENERERERERGRRKSEGAEETDGARVEKEGRYEVVVLHSSVSLFPRRLRLAHGNCLG